MTHLKRIGIGLIILLIPVGIIGVLLLLPLIVVKYVVLSILAVLVLGVAYLIGITWEDIYR